MTRHERPATPDAYLTLKSLAAYSALSVRTLRGYLANRVQPLPHYRVGGRIVRQTEFDQWLRQFRVHPSDVSVEAIVDHVLDGLK